MTMSECVIQKVFINNGKEEVADPELFSICHRFHSLIFKVSKYCESWLSNSRCQLQINFVMRELTY